MNHWLIPLAVICVTPIVAVIAIVGVQLLVALVDEIEDKLGW